MKLTHRQKIEVYMRLLRHFEAGDYRWRTEEFRLILEGTRREELSYFRSLMTEAGEPFGATWRDIPFKLHKVKECAHPECGRPFYDVSRNGRMSYCHWHPYTRYNYAANERRSDEYEDGTVKSVCQMRYDADRNRREYNRKVHGIDTDTYRYNGFYEDYGYEPGESFFGK
ncbi:CGNR zinc finger domain-containing protein [Paenibacillus polymyxa]|uniref:CGNR zinc finger domain-containing protein n=1 Tax=Paenibacillus polymyxa TaxID=1406 RepID=UPI000737C608|nr:CGNR zinc finger domain-containing protein [Paenibacillus polymyxa]